MCISKSGKAK